jgi:hypothetical protein
VLPRHAFSSLESSSLVKNGTGFSLTAGAKPGGGVWDLVLMHEVDRGLRRALGL